jgi:hypothetical protein
MKETRNIRTCFVSAPQGTELEAVHASLLAHGITPIVPQELRAGTDLASEVQRALRQADLIIGVFPAARESPWVLFELGQAWALGKPIVLIAPPGVQVPSPLQGLLVLQITPDNRAALDFTLDQLIAAPAEPPPQAASKPSTFQALGARADEFLARIEEALLPGNASLLEKAISDAIRASGVNVLAESGGGDRGFDLAVWSDVLAPFVGNPLLVEVKARLSSTAALLDSLRKLFASSTATGGQWALLVYGEGQPPGPRFLAEAPPNVLVISARSLLEELRTRTFPEIIRDLRNRRVHGARP